MNARVPYFLALSPVHADVDLNTTDEELIVEARTHDDPLVCSLGERLGDALDLAEGIEEIDGLKDEIAELKEETNGFKDEIATLEHERDDLIDQIVHLEQQLEGTET